VYDMWMGMQIIPFHAINKYNIAHYYDQGLVGLTCCLFLLTIFSMFCNFVNIRSDLTG